MHHSNADRRLLFGVYAMQLEIISRAELVQSLSQWSRDKSILLDHSRGVIHRDLKPDNVILGKFGETLMVDWGLAKVVGRGDDPPSDAETTLRPNQNDSAEPTRCGDVLETPAYMSPEQAAGRHNDVGPAIDIYSLGATLYSLLVGEAPHTDNDIAAILHTHHRTCFWRLGAII